MASSGEKDEESSPPLRKSPRTPRSSAPKSSAPRLTAATAARGVFGRLDNETRYLLEASVKLENPFHGLTPEELGRRGGEFCARHGIEGEDDVRAFRLSAMITGDMNRYGAVAGLTAREREGLDREFTHKWRNSSTLYAVIVICSLCAAVQGVDKTVVNGAQYFYRRQFGIGDPQAAKAAPYTCCAFFGCWVIEHMNKGFGRRGTVSISCVIPAVTRFAPGHRRCGIASVILHKELAPRRLKTVLRLRYEKVQAARDLFYADTFLQVEREAMDIGRSKLREIFTQFCGVNAIAYYSTEIYIQSSFQEQAALAASLGFGVINWLFALPGMYTIDTFGLPHDFLMHGWNLVGFVAVLLLLPETKEKTLEELGAVSDVPVAPVVRQGVAEVSTSDPITSCAGTLGRRSPSPSCDNIEYARGSHPTARA
ncbi:hypothetical protein DL771_006942 [Monosporascus sp. 5C6A]|nr:hypothetical protein DL771_006942 [Monosporascus sp. 5C6A]